MAGTLTRHGCARGARKRARRGAHPRAARCVQLDSLADLNAEEMSILEDWQAKLGAKYDFLGPLVEAHDARSNGTDG